MRIRGCSAAVFDLSAQLLAGVVLNVGHQDAGTLFGESFGGFAPIPLAAPVTRATLPVSLCMSNSFRWASTCCFTLTRVGRARPDLHRMTGRPCASHATIPPSRSCAFSMPASDICCIAVLERFPLRQYTA